MYASSCPIYIDSLYETIRLIFIYLLGARHSMSADLYFTRDSFFLSFFLLFLPPNLRARWTELNQIGHMVGTKCNLKMHVQNLGYPFPLQIGGPKTTLLGRLRNLTTNLAAYIFGTKHDVDNR